MCKACEVEGLPCDQFWRDMKDSPRFRDAVSRAMDEAANENHESLGDRIDEQEEQIEDVREKLDDYLPPEVIRNVLLQAGISPRNTDELVEAMDRVKGGGEANV